MSESSITAAQEPMDATGGGTGGGHARSMVASTVPKSFGEAFGAYRSRVRTGELGSLPAFLGILLLVLIFGVAKPDLVSASNLISVIQNAAAPITLAMGLVFVLLLGEIDLSAGVVGSAAAAFGAVFVQEHGVNWLIAILLAIVFGTVCGTVMGALRSWFGIPSFVVTLAAFIAFQGVQQFLTGANGKSMASQPVIHDLDWGTLSQAGGWILLAIAVVGYGVVKFFQRADRARQNLPSEPLSVLLLRLGLLVVGGAVFVYVCNINEDTIGWQVREHLYLGGVPWPVPIIGVLAVVFTFVLSKTRYGRHVYAVGGNQEAARRAGIPVRVVRTSVFAICSGLAAVSGMFLASSYSSDAADTQGLGNTLLLAVAAAVVGGTSLMGGRGRVVDAVLGGTALTILAYGMSDLLSGNSSTQWEEIITGIVLLLAAGVDATSRHAGRASG